MPSPPTLHPLPDLDNPTHSHPQKNSLSRYQLSCLLNHHKNLPYLSDLIQKSNSMHTVQILWLSSCQLKETEIKNATKEILYQTFLPITYIQAPNYILAANPHFSKIEIWSEIQKVQTYFLNHITSRLHKTGNTHCIPGDACQYSDN
jgi:hypothetical protein